MSESRIAYFSMEIALHPAMPTYSGGLGMLAGDMLRAAADVHARRARDLGVRVSIDTDTHYLDELDNMALGVATGRRAWIGPDQVVNALPLDRLLEWARGGR